MISYDIIDLTVDEDVESYNQGQRERWKALRTRQEDLNKVVRKRLKRTLNTLNEPIVSSLAIQQNDAPVHNVLPVPIQVRQIVHLLHKDLWSIVLSYLDGAEAYFTASILDKHIRSVIRERISRYSSPLHNGLITRIPILNPTKFNFSPYSNVLTASSFKSSLQLSISILVTSIILSNCKRLSTDLFDELLKLRNITLLDLSDCVVTQPFIEKLPLSCKKLNDLRLRNCRIGDSSAIHLVRQLRLRVLDFSSCLLTNEFTLQCASQLKNITHASLQHNDLNVREYIQNCHMSQYLDLSYCQLTQGSLLSIKFCTSIQYLNIECRQWTKNRVNSVSDNEVQLVLCHCKQLQHFNCSNHAITDNALSTINNYLHFQLRCLKLRKCMNLSKDGLLKIARNFPLLTDLDISCGIWKDHDITSFATALLTHKQLSTLKNHALTGSAVDIASVKDSDTISGNTSLKRLNISGCITLTDSCMDAVISRCFALDQVYIGGCHYIDNTRLKTQLSNAMQSQSRIQKRRRWPTVSST